MRYVARCECACHSACHADYCEAVQDRRWWDAREADERSRVEHFPPTSDVIEAAVACDACRGSHSPALLPRLIWGPRDVVRVDEGEGPEC